MNHKRTFLLLFLHVLLFTVRPVMAQQYKVRSFCWERVEVTSQLDAEPSVEAAALVAPYRVKVDSIMAPPLGLSRVAMNAMRPESLLSNWAADVMVEGGTATGLEPADMGLFNIGGLRNNMPEGIVRRGDIILISPFQNYVVVLEMQGKDLLELMQNIAATKGEGVSSSVRMQITADGQLLSNRPPPHIHRSHHRLSGRRKRQDVRPQESHETTRNRTPRPRSHDGVRPEAPRHRQQDRR